ncbi:MAG: hemerythrin domain-containing protein [Elusimicrobia bacterium]|nr:hemerythrin domain-containing protein [Elusimicrobiota bacterium]MDE2236464.1 hemerythrin domain-containing protein [Elusimicrobiota bacterium]MDE2424843.1 hemerythrin domain-containing protein [Elusimicrobiota bacterium]
MSDIISQFFEKDHREIDALLEAVDYRRPQESYETFHEFHMRLERHIHWEEGVLFPAVAQRAPHLEMGPIRVMLSEHEQIRLHKSAALRALKLGEGAGAQYAARTMLSVLADHNAKEERILYPACDSCFSDAEAEALLTKVRAMGPRKAKERQPG